MTTSDKAQLCRTPGPVALLVALLGAELIDEYRREYGVGPKGINSGYCSSFAEDLCARLRMEKHEGAFPLDSADVATRLRHGEGELLEGVLDWRDLPFFRRWYTKRRRPSRRDPLDVERARLRRSAEASTFVFRRMADIIERIDAEPDPTYAEIAKNLGRSVDDEVRELVLLSCGMPLDAKLKSEPETSGQGSLFSGP